MESVAESAYKNHHVKVVNTITSQAYNSKGTRSVADFTNPDKKSLAYQSGISVSHKNANDVKVIDFRDKTGKSKQNKSQAGTSMRKTTHTSYKRWKEDLIKDENYAIKLIK